MIDVRSYNKDSTPYTFYSQAALFVVQPVPYTKLIPYQNTKLFTEPNGNQPSHQNTKQPKGSFYHNGSSRRKERIWPRLFSIPVIDGKDKTNFQEWFRHILHTCVYSNRSLHKELPQRSAGAVTNVLLKMEPTTKTEKIKKALQEYFSERPTQLHTSRELTETQMWSDEYIIEFNDRYTTLLEESTDEIPKTCKSKIVIVAYIDALYDSFGRKLRSNIAKFEDDPCHPKP